MVSPYHGRASIARQEITCSVVTLPLVRCWYTPVPTPLSVTVGTITYRNRCDADYMYVHAGHDNGTSCAGKRDRQWRQGARTAPRGDRREL